MAQITINLQKNGKEFGRKIFILIIKFLRKNKFFGEKIMHFAISASWGPTDPTRAMLPFIFAASALQVKDTVTIMLFHDAVHLALKGFAEKIVPVGPPQRFKEIVDDNNAKLLVCTPCAEVRNIFEKDCLDKFIFGGMNDFHEACKILDTKIICY